MRRARGCGDERGSGSVLVLMIVALAVVLLVSAGVLAQARAASVRAQNAADQAALAAADARRGLSPGEPCDQAGRLARANGAELTGCRLAGEVAEADVRVAIVGGVPLAVTRTARAGPPPDRTQAWST